MSDQPPIDGTVFFILANVVNADGTCDFDCEIPSSFLTLKEAVSAAREGLLDYGGAAILFEARAVKRLEAKRVVKATDIAPLPPDRRAGGTDV